MIFIAANFKLDSPAIQPIRVSHRQLRLILDNPVKLVFAITPMTCTRSIIRQALNPLSKYAPKELASSANNPGQGTTQSGLMR
jgi:hypothetical protein